MQRTSIGCPGRNTTPAAVGVNENVKVAVGDGSSVFINKVGRNVIGSASPGPGELLTAATTDVDALSMRDKHVALHTLNVGTDGRVVLGASLVVVALAVVVIVAED
jgi:hypothetical protein